jgi:DMSO/TMAO reductase YedYZ molybdopterin-dependent catalytic subunit
LALDYAGRYVTLECVDNPAGGPLASTAHWIGVPLAHLLALIRPGSEAARVVVVGEDGLDEAIPLSRLGELDPLLAYGMNGAPLPLAHGFPLRFVVPGYYGFKNVKWVRQIRLDRAGPGYWARRGWDDLPPIRSTARIEVARRSDGGILLAGVAFAGARGVQRVDVRVDGGSWRAAELRQPALDRASWQQWRLTVAPGARLVEARVIDGTGAVPPAERTGSFPSGAGGWSQREVTT